ncbi:ammonium transporter [Clostridium oryzae]|uniref:Ammonium transporter n=1 Tax=Clostridium oryzae TaxID=1450648 RepID=A0A1V4IQQ2_9CLOT|nr:ammonium transporter [Clostridium oryzae]OPJ62134.1 ammonium transporter NrgA [Clostridium oryzae]
MGHINYADTTFVFLSTVLVMFMTPGLALFYSGMVRRKNVLSTTMHSYATIAVVSLQWVILGYSLSFGHNIGGFVGGFDFAFLNNVGFKANAAYASNIPQQIFMMFQMMFAVITPALISGAFAGRMRFPAFLIFTLLWSTLVYDPVAHWVWGDGGWLKTLGALDFAGGNVVHMSSGVSALVIALFIGKRKGINEARPHNLPLTILGAGILWFGWFGFNAGSALAINNVALNAFITTNTAAAAAALSWMFCEWAVFKKPSAMGFASGAVAGLVAITPGAGFVSMGSSLIIGLIGGAICFYSVTIMKKKIGYDDALDAFGCHGVGGTWGAIATGIFASKSINSAGADGLIHGSFRLLGVQFLGIIAVYVFAAVVTLLILVVVNHFTKFRATEDEEEVGLDISMHGESGYSLES